MLGASRGLLCDRSAVLYSTAVYLDVGPIAMKDLLKESRGLSVTSDAAVITARQHSLLCREESAVLAIIDSVYLSVRLSVTRCMVSCHNDSSYDHAVFTTVKLLP